MAVATTFAAKTAATKVYAAAAPVSLGTTVGKCSPVLAAEASTLDTWYADPVTVSGALTRDVGGQDVPVANASLPVTVTTTTTTNGKATTKVASLGSAKTLADGSFSLVVKPTTSGLLKVALPASTSYNATTVEVGDLVVNTPTTELTGDVDPTTTAYGRTVTVTGSLTKEASSTLPVAGATVAVKVAAPGKAPVQVATGKTAANGSFAVAVPLKVSGALSVVFAGSAGLPAASAAVDTVAAESWDVAIGTPTASPASVAPAKPATITGSVTRTYGGATEPAKSLAVVVTVQPTGGTATTTKATTNASGLFTVKVSPKVTTTYTVRVAGVAGHDDASAAPVTVTVVP